VPNSLQYLIDLYRDYRGTTNQIQNQWGQGYLQN
jgi:hypothetical protein